MPNERLSANIDRKLCDMRLPIIKKKKQGDSDFLYKNILNGLIYCRKVLPWSYYKKEISALESVQREIIQNITRAKYGLSETGENKRKKIFD